MPSIYSKATLCTGKIRNFSRGISVSVKLSANQRALYAYVNNLLTEHKHKHKKKAYVYAYVAAVLTSAEASHAYAYACVAIEDGLWKS